MTLSDVPPEFIRTAADRQAIAEGCRWSEHHAQAVVEFAHRFFKPAVLLGGAQWFELLKWQAEWLRGLYGWRRPDGQSRWRTVNLHIAKKNSKTTLVAIVALYEMFAAGVSSPFIASGSVTKDNASQVFDAVKYALDRCALKPFAQITPNQKKIKIPGTNGEYRALSSDGDSAQGYNLSCAIVDELHAHKNDSLYDSLRYSVSARKGWLITLSTAGDDVTCSYYTGPYTKSKNIISGDDLDTSHYATVYEADADGDPLDPKQWHKANPSLVWFGEEDFKRELDAARGSVAEWMKFRRYKLNQWVRPDELAFIDVQRWDRNATQLPDAALVGCPCWMGADLSTSIDPSSVSLCWLMPDGRYHVRSYAWICSRGLVERDKVNAQSYRQYVVEKSMVETPGDMIEHRKILEWMRTEGKRWRVKSIRMDGNNAQLIGETLMSEGFAVEFVPQYPRHWDWPMREFERCVIDGRLTHSGSSWLRDCVSHVRAKANEREELRPIKPDPSAKIDGFISCVLAFTPAALEASKPKRSARIEVW